MVPRLTVPRATPHLSCPPLCNAPDLDLSGHFIEDPLDSNPGCGRASPGRRSRGCLAAAREVAPRREPSSIALERRLTDRGSASRAANSLLWRASDIEMQTPTPPRVRPRSRWHSRLSGCDWDWPHRAEVNLSGGTVGGHHPFCVIWCGSARGSRTISRARPGREQPAARKRRRSSSSAPSGS